MIDLSIVVPALPQFAAGLGVTLLLLALSLGAGFVLSVPLAVARVSRKRAMSHPVWLFTYLIRGTPLLVQLFIVYHGLAQFEAVRESIFWPALRNPWFCAWLAFTINTTAYTTEIFAGALRATPAGEVEAARSYGMSGLMLYRRVLLPSALRRALPQYSNEVVGLMHATAVASTVNLVDITRVARDVYANHLVVTESFGTAALIYLVLTMGMVALFKVLERRFLAHLQPQSGAITPAIAAQPAHP